MAKAADHLMRNDSRDGYRVAGRDLEGWLMTTVEASAESRIAEAQCSTIAAPWRVPAPLSAADYSQIRRRLILDHCKWDPQVGDVRALAAFPLIIEKATWLQVTEWAQQLTSEALAAEAELLQSPKLLKMLGLPASVRRLLSRGQQALSPTAARIFRFDFHCGVTSATSENVLSPPLLIDRRRLRRR
jgi:hypothetical protein